jgi:predicted O-methyltransferase YrrM
MTTETWLDDAASVGRTIDLSGCRYRSDVAAPTPAHYQFLAGVVRVTKASRILEVGTFHGGTVMAMARGIDPSIDHPQIVTIDVVELNRQGLAGESRVRRIIRDSLSRRTVSEVTEIFDDHIDVLFVDSGHDFRQAFENVAVYGNLLKPRLIVLDDITLNRSMERMWAEVVRLAPGATTDVSEIAGRTKVGFGLIEPDYPFTWPQMHPVRLAAWRAYWGTARFVMPRLSGRRQQQLRALLRGQAPSRHPDPAGSGRGRSS